MDTVNFYLDFGGFYNSYLDLCIDSALDNERDYQETEHNKTVYPTLKDYKKVCEDISKEYITALNETLFFETELKEEPTLKYISLDSPKYYNFETDTILTQISIKDLKALLRLVDRSKLVDYINEASKSRDGFISFYDGFEAVKKDLSVFCRYFFNYLFEVYEIDQSTVCENNNMSEVIFDAVNENMEFQE